MFFAIVFLLLHEVSKNHDSGVGPHVIVSFLYPPLCVFFQFGINKKRN